MWVCALLCGLSYVSFIAPDGQGAVLAGERFAETHTGWIPLSENDVRLH